MFLPRKLLVRAAWPIAAISFCGQISAQLTDPGELRAVHEERVELETEILQVLGELADSQALEALALLLAEPESSSDTPRDDSATTVETRLHDLARETDIEGLEVDALEPFNLEPGVLGDSVRVRGYLVKGSAELGFVDRFFRLLRLRYDTIAVRGLRLEAIDLGSVRFEARLRRVTSEIERFSVKDITDLTIGELRGKNAELRAVLDQLQELKLRPDPFVPVRAFHDAHSDEAIELRSFAYENDSLLVEGVAVGPAARSALPGLFHSSGIDTQSLVWTSEGKCRAFRVTSPLTKIETTSTTFENGIFGQTDCSGNPGPRLGIVSVENQKTGGDRFSIRTGEIRIRNAFRILHDLTNENFIIEPGVGGTVRLQVENASFDEVLAALATLGIRTTSAPIHRVIGPAEGSHATSEERAGETLSMQLLDAPLHSILCIFSDVVELDIFVEPELHPRLTVLVADQPWTYILTEIIRAAGADYAFEGNRMLVRREIDQELPDFTRSPHSCDSAFRFASTLLWTKLERLGIDDVTLVATMNGADGEVRGYLEGPFGELYVVTAGARLFDGEVAEITEDAVRVRTATTTRIIPSGSAPR